MTSVCQGWRPSFCEGLQWVGPGTQMTLDDMAPLGRGSAVKGGGSGPGPPWKLCSWVMEK